MSDPDTDDWTQFSSVALSIALEMQELFSFEDTDRPDRALGKYPNPTRVIECLKVLIDVMFPGRFSSGISEANECLPFLSERLVYVAELLGPELERAIPFQWLGATGRKDGTAPIADVKKEAERILGVFYSDLPAIRKMLIEDVRAAYAGDPAALTYAEVQTAYPGLLAVASHRIAHSLYVLNVPIVPRIMSEWTHTQTGIDIHPGAKIGAAFFIDHGTGTVIGETAIIGNNVKLYQGATLGARSFPVDADGNPVKHIKRHPTVEDDVVVYANAVILGGKTVIGKGSTIGGGVSVMESVPPGSLVIASRPELKIRPRS